MNPEILTPGRVRSLDPFPDSRDPAPTEGPLVDTYGRVHRDLRISLTDKCSLRCRYCMPAEGVEWMAQESVLSTDELVRVAGVAVGLGITTIRLTGGEPLLYADVAEVVRRTSQLKGPGGPVRVAVTTNGIKLPQMLPGLVDSGLARLNISIDTLRRDRFFELTRRDKLDRVIAGIGAARDSGLKPLKLNAVAMRGVNDDELVDLVEFAIENDAQMRFIEQMPLDAGHTWDRGEMVTRDEILTALGERFDLAEIPGRGGAPAETFTLDGGPHTVGVIASVTAPFCGNCDRLRLTADGQLRNCLFARTEHDLKPVLRGGGSDSELESMLRHSIWRKLPGHGINDPGFLQPDRGMNAIGG
ncbi:MAG: GTP 3',8-cyclase MoaA [Solirubrobacterales bacterium]|nr:GTP 3',8-cyclase MoaA [Solirubrobacterales bacterium]